MSLRERFKLEDIESDNFKAKQTFPIKEEETAQALEASEHQATNEEEVNLKG